MQRGGGSPIFMHGQKGGYIKKLFKYIASKNCKPLIQLEGPQLLKLHHKNNVYEHYKLSLSVLQDVVEGPPSFPISRFDKLRYLLCNLSLKLEKCGGFCNTIQSILYLPFHLSFDRLLHFVLNWGRSHSGTG